MVQQKKGIVLLLLLSWGIYETVNVFGPTYYATAEDASYQHYMDILHGPVTEETLEFVAAEEERLNALWLELMEIGADPGGSDYLRYIQIQSELESREGGFYLVQQQLEGLKVKEGPLEEKLLLDERSYISLWWDAGRDLGLFFIGSATLLFFISSIRTLDERKKMLPLLRSTGTGTESWIGAGPSALFCARCSCIWLRSCLCFCAISRSTILPLWTATA